MVYRWQYDSFPFVLYRYDRGNPRSSVHPIAAILYTDRLCWFFDQQGAVTKIQTIPSDVRYCFTYIREYVTTQDHDYPLDQWCASSTEKE